VRTILSFSSQVIDGHVGNSAAAPAFWALGHRLLAVPTILLAHHPGHGGFAGLRVEVSDLKIFWEGLRAHGALDGLAGLMTGYLASPGQAAEISTAIAVAKSKGAPLHLADPVLGDDHTGLFVPGPVADAQRMLLNGADIATPNRFELAWLTGRAVTNLAETIDALKLLNVPCALCTSAPLEDPGLIGTVLVTEGQAFVTAAPRRAEVPHGLGDLFSALFLGHRLKGEDAASALAWAAGGVAHALDHVRKAGPLDLELAAAGPALVSPARLPAVTPVLT